MAMFVKPPKTQRIKCIFFLPRPKKTPTWKRNKFQADSLVQNFAYYQNKEQRKRLRDKK